MTDLTEQWKKGELPNGWYWIEGSRAEGIYAYTAEYLNHMYRPKNSDRIIERVPTFDEYQKLLSDQLAKIEGEEINAELEEENTKLKEQLAIAIEALKCYEQENWAYADEYNYFPFNEYTGGWCHAEKALEQIKELDK